MEEMYYCLKDCWHNRRLFKAHERYPASSVGETQTPFLIKIKPPAAPPEKIAEAITELNTQIADMEKNEVFAGKNMPPHPATVKRIRKMKEAVDELEAAAATKKAAAGKG